MFSLSARTTNLPYNKRMQSDLTKRYALASAADAGRYEALASRM